MGRVSVDTIEKAREWVQNVEWLRDNLPKGTTIYSVVHTYNPASLHRKYTLHFVKNGELLNCTWAVATFFKMKLKDHKGRRVIHSQDDPATTAAYLSHKLWGTHGCYSTREL